MAEEREKLPITLITQAYNMILSNEPGYETRLFDQLAPIVKDICVVVQDSFDDTLPVVLEYTRDVLLERCIYHPEPYRNMLLGMALAKESEWVLFMDTDMYFKEDPYDMLKKYIEMDDVDAVAFAHENYLAPDRDTPGNIWGGPQHGANLGTWHLFRKHKCKGSPPLLHYPFMHDADTRKKPVDEIICHRGMHFATERWKVYYPAVVRRLKEFHAGDEGKMGMIDGVSNCHWGADSTTFAKGTGAKDVDIRGGVRVQFVNAPEQNQTWPFIKYTESGSGIDENAHVVVFGDERIRYAPQFIERCLEGFVMFPHVDAVKASWMGRLPEGMDAATADFACTLFLKALLDKGKTRSVYDFPRHLAKVGEDKV